jgi:predicted transcriptional regulator
MHALSVIVSIRPEHVKNIISGRKTVELRRRFPERLLAGTLLLIYSSKPDQTMCGVARIDSVEKLRIKRLWDLYGRQACLSRKAFFEYFVGRVEGFVRVHAALPKQVDKIPDDGAPSRMPQQRDIFDLAVVEEFPKVLC